MTTATTTRRTARFRVTCSDITCKPVYTEDAARNLVASIVKLGSCLNPHTVETLTDEGEWLPTHIAKAREILAAPTTTRIDLPDGPLIVQHRIDLHVPAEADAAYDAGDLERFRALLGPAREAVLSGDGRGVDSMHWCTCEPAPDASTWARYERWSERGREAHGYVCPNCRHITQTG